MNSASIPEVYVQLGPYEKGSGYISAWITCSPMLEVYCSFIQVWGTISHTCKRQELRSVFSETCRILQEGLKFLRPLQSQGKNLLFSGPTMWIALCYRNINTIYCKDKNVAEKFITVWQNIMYLTKYHLGTQSYLSAVSPRKIWKMIPTERCEVKIFHTRDTVD